MNAIPRLKRNYRGASLLSYGFRPFFLFGGLYAAVAMVVWLPLFFGRLALTTSFIPRDWHIHEMLFGYLAAIVTGFLLTAVPNWTGRLPLQGRPLLTLVVAWAAGRVAIALSALSGDWLAGIVDCSFLFLVAAAVAREIIAGRNWRNLKVMVPITVLALANVAFHVEADVFGYADYSVRLSAAAIVILIMLIGGRIVPSFTRNFLARANPGRLPIPFTSFDATALAFGVTALVLWILFPAHVLTAIGLSGAGILQAWRLARWAGDRAVRDRLVLVLHVAYLFVPLGFVLAGVAGFGVLPESAALHAWMAGAAGMMTLAVMTRASLGHTGRALTASWPTQGVYAALFVAAVARLAAALIPEWTQPLILTAGLGWIAAFAGFVVLYGPMLLRPQVSATSAEAPR